MNSESRFAIGDLADLGGVSRRTVRYYVQEGLLPPPYGVGRGDHYGREHLDQLLRVKALQEAGRTLSEIRETLGDAMSHEPVTLRADRAFIEPSDTVALERTLWRRVTLAPGVELHVSSEVRLPSQLKLNELASWCRMHLVTAHKEEDIDDRCR